MFVYFELKSMQSENESVRKAGFAFSPSSRLRSLFWCNVLRCAQTVPLLLKSSLLPYYALSDLFLATITKLWAIQKSRFYILNLTNIAKTVLLNANSTNSCFCCLIPLIIKLKISCYWNYQFQLSPCWISNWQSIGQAFVTVVANQIHNSSLHLSD